MHKAVLPFTILFWVATTVYVHAQKTWEAAIKPSQIIFNDLELNVGLGNHKHFTGLILSYRPSTKDSGKIKGGAAAFEGGYTLQNMYNRLYRAYTVGLYRKSRFPGRKIFLETDLFYRNWSFQNKPAEYQDIEGYRFNGNRTENVDVIALKLLFGNTFPILPSRPSHLFIDIFSGVGVRYKKSVYETREGTVFDIYYDYKKDIFREVLPSLHFGIRAGITGKR